MAEQVHTSSGSGARPQRLLLRVSRGAVSIGGDFKVDRADVPRANPDSRQVSMTSTWIDIEMEGSAFYKSQEQEERYNPFKGLTN